MITHKLFLGVPPNSVREVRPSETRKQMPPSEVVEGVREDNPSPLFRLV